MYDSLEFRSASGRTLSSIGLWSLLHSFTRFPPCRLIMPTTQVKEAYNEFGRSVRRAIAPSGLREPPILSSGMGFWDFAWEILRLEHTFSWLSQDISVQLRSHRSRLMRTLRVCSLNQSASKSMVGRVRQGSRSSGMQNRSLMVIVQRLHGQNSVKIVVRRRTNIDVLKNITFHTVDQSETDLSDLGLKSTPRPNHLLSQKVE